MEEQALEEMRRRVAALQAVAQHQEQQTAAAMQILDKLEAMGKQHIETMGNAQAEMMERMAKQAVTGDMMKSRSGQAPQGGEGHADIPDGRSEDTEKK